jgi:hypothetical protein
LKFLNTDLELIPLCRAGCQSLCRVDDHPTIWAAKRNRISNEQLPSQVDVLR